MLHLMQDLLHWAHKLARNGLVELGCVSRGPENDCKGNWDKKYRRNAWVIQAYVLPLHPVRSAGKDFSRFASTIKSDNGAVHFVGTVPLFLYILHNTSSRLWSTEHYFAHDILFLFLLWSGSLSVVGSRLKRL